ncbi:hypothetical protein QQ045_029876 [Rhodiola kirilowii]
MSRFSCWNNWAKGHYTERAGLIDSVMDVACKWRTLMRCKVQVDQLDFVSR